MTSPSQTFTLEDLPNVPMGEKGCANSVRQPAAAIGRGRQAVYDNVAQLCPAEENAAIATDQQQRRL